VDNLNLNLWKGRLLAAEAVLGAPSPATTLVTRKVLADATAALDASVRHLQELLDEVRALRQRLGESDRRYESLVRSIPVPMVTTSRTGEIVELNPAAASLINVKIRGAIGRSLLLFFVAERDWWLGRISDMRDTDPAVEREVIVRPKEKALRKLMACVCPANDGALHWYLLSGSGPHAGAFASASPDTDTV
jgi:PAS domain S-box-containing protein